jgi:hypothetical protein
MNINGVPVKSPIDPDVAELLRLAVEAIRVADEVGIEDVRARVAYQAADELAMRITNRLNTTT